MLDKDRPTWQLPPGVPRGAWDYVNQKSIATEYDQFHAGHPLLDLDRRIVARHTLDTMSSIPTGQESPRVVMDFGCGTGRNLIPFHEKGWRTIGVDLSQSMLRECRDQLRSDAGSMGTSVVPAFVQTNMVQLDCFADEIADVALCMYSSLGMVQGRSNRQTVLRSFRRLLRRSGLFIVHVHNRGTWWRDPGGMRRMVSDWVRSRRDRSWEYGDRVYAYRGLPSMFLHIYSERELLTDLSMSGFRLQQLYRLNRQSSERMRGNWLSGFRCGGWIAVCQKVP